MIGKYIHTGDWGQQDPELLFLSLILGEGIQVPVGPDVQEILREKLESTKGRKHEKDGYRTTRLRTRKGVRTEWHCRLLGLGLGQFHVAATLGTTRESSGSPVRAILR